MFVLIVVFFVVVFSISLVTFFVQLKFLLQINYKIPIRISHIAIEIYLKRKDFCWRRLGKLKKCTQVLNRRIRPTFNGNQVPRVFTKILSQIHSPFLSCVHMYINLITSFDSHNWRRVLYSNQAASLVHRRMLFPY